MYGAQLQKHSQRSLDLSKQSTMLSIAYFDGCDKEIQIYSSISQFYKVQYQNVLPNNGEHPVICEDLIVTRMWITRALPHHFTKKRGLGNTTILTPQRFIVPSQNNERSCICVLRI